MTGLIDIATIWAFIIAFAVFVYVVMDGFDLGLGILFPLFPAKADRDVMILRAAGVVHHERRLVTAECNLAHRDTDTARTVDERLL